MPHELAHGTVTRATRGGDQVLTLRDTLGASKLGDDMTGGATSVSSDAMMAPEGVLRNAALSDQEKASILCQMAYDAAELAVATDEGMPGNDSDLQRRVLLALRELHRSIDVEHTGPTKQHAACLRQTG